MKKFLFSFIFVISPLLSIPMSKEEKEEAFKVAVLENDLKTVKALVNLGIEPKKTFFNSPIPWAPMMATMKCYWEMLDFFLITATFSQEEKNKLLTCVATFQTPYQASHRFYTYIVLLHHRANLDYLPASMASYIRENYLS